MKSPPLLPSILAHLTTAGLLPPPAAALLEIFDTPAADFHLLLLLPAPAQLPPARHPPSNQPMQIETTDTNLLPIIPMQTDITMHANPNSVQPIPSNHPQSTQQCPTSPVNPNISPSTLPLSPFLVPVPVLIGSPSGLHPGKATKKSHGAYAIAMKKVATHKKSQTLRRKLPIDTVTDAMAVDTIHLCSPGKKAKVDSEVNLAQGPSDVSIMDSEEGHTNSITVVVNDESQPHRSP